MTKPITVELETKSFGLELKSVDEDLGIIKGYLSVFNNVDSHNDRVRPSAFKKTLQEAIQRKSKGKKVLYPLLYMHDPEKPIGGVVDAIEDKVGLLITAQLDISTNEQGIPNNPLATSVFSGFKQGFIDELSIGYKAIQKSYEAGTGVRDLSEIQLFEASAITMNFASNPEAQVTQVKAAGGMELAPRNTPWSKSKAIKDIEAATKGDWAKASKYFFWSAANPTTEADHKLPFCAMSGGSMKAIPQAIISAAAAVQGARGGVKGIDVDSVKSKIAGYYSRMGMTPPWSADKGKAMDIDLETKDFNDYYRMRNIADWANRWSSLVNALRSAVKDAFSIGDMPASDIEAALQGDPAEDSPGFIHAVMDWVNEGIALDVSNYIKQPDVDSLSNPSGIGYTDLGYMFANLFDIETKAGAVVSGSNTNRLQGHVNTLRTVADDISHYITGDQDAYVPDGGAHDATAPFANTGKSKQYRPLPAPNGNQPDDNATDFEALVADWLENQLQKKTA